MSSKRTKSSTSSSHSSSSHNNNSKGVEDLWDKVNTHFSSAAIDQQDNESSGFETVTLIVGETGSGKTSLLNNFLKASSSSNSKQPKSTFGLDYSFARKKGTVTSSSGTQGGGKVVAHLWELGGDMTESELVKVPLALSTLKHTSVIICIDLSKPHNVLQSLLKWIDLIQQVSQDRMQEWKSRLPDEYKQFREKRLGSVNPQHPDAKSIHLTKLPLHILGTKYDHFKDLGLQEKRAINTALRFAAHYYGASLVYVSLNDAHLRELARTVLSNISFGVSGVSTGGVNVEKPLHLYAGGDRFSYILNDTGNSPGNHASTSSNEDGADMANAAALQPFLSNGSVTKNCWEKLAEKLYNGLGIHPDDLPSTQEGNGGDDAGTVNEYPEPMIDEERARRDANLRRYIQEVERREAAAEKLNREGKEDD